jgi:hypothetical protein
MFKKFFSIAVLTLLLTIGFASRTSAQGFYDRDDFMRYHMNDYDRFHDRDDFMRFHHFPRFYDRDDFMRFHHFPMPYHYWYHWNY